MRGLSAAALLGLGLATSVATARADEWQPTPAAVPATAKGIDIDDRRGSTAPKDLAFTNQDGKRVAFGDYFDGQHPVVVVMAYYECPMLCTLVLNGLSSGLSNLAWSPGKEFRVVTVSFDPRDTVEAASKKRASYVKSYGRFIGDRGWDFLVGDPDSVRKLADGIGFRYRWDAEQKQFAHAAGAFVFTSDGRLSQVLKGISFPERDLRLALTEASEGKLGSTWDQILLLCYHYDPAAGNYVLWSVRLMQMAGFLTVLLFGGWLLRMWRRDLARSVTPAGDVA
jgi:protein SCO1/2